MKKILAAIATTVALAAISAPATAASIPYPDSGSYNLATYTFVVAHTGDVSLYFAGSEAGNSNQISISINGSTSPDIFLNHGSTAIGTPFDFGSFTKGQVVTFTLQTNSSTFSSDPALNVGLDGANPLNDQHIYATEYHHHAAGWSLPKSGLFLAFEDLPLTSSDRDFNDETFVATNVKIANPCYGGGVPEPATWAAMIVGFAGIGAAMRKKAASGSFAALS
jgi:hypothetical protein